jgi:hypothetical protein
VNLKSRSAEAATPPTGSSRKTVGYDLPFTVPDASTPPFHRDVDKSEGRHGGAPHGNAWSVRKINS